MAKKRIPLLHWYTLPALFVVALILFILCIYYFVQYQRTKTLLDTPAVAVAQEADTILQEIRPIIYIPQDEKPTIATVADKTKLAGQPFFDRAENGDKVLIFKTSNTVVLYRPSIKKVIAVSNIPQGQQAPMPTITQQSGGSFRVAVLNGSRLNGIAKKNAEFLSQKIENITIVKEETAEKKTYTKAQIIYLKPRAQEIATQIARLLDGEISSNLPEGEVGFDVDIIVIAIR